MLPTQRPSLQVSVPEHASPSSHAAPSAFRVAVQPPSAGMQTLVSKHAVGVAQVDLRDHHRRRGRLDLPGAAIVHRANLPRHAAVRRPPQARADAGTPAPGAKFAYEAKLQLGGIAGHFSAALSTNVASVGVIAPEQAILREWDDYGAASYTPPMSLLGTPAEQVFKLDAMANADCVPWFVAFAAKRVTSPS
mgnify:CR=1 FL=1